MAALAVAVVVALVVVWLLRRAVVGPVQAFMLFVERVGRGELSGAPAATGADEMRAAGRDAEQHGGGAEGPRDAEQGGDEQSG